MEKKIYQNQISTLNLIKNYLINLKKKKVKIEIAPVSDFVTWVNCLGFSKLKLLEKKKNISIDYIKTILIEIISIGRNYEYSLISSKIKSKKKFNVIYSYCKKDDFKKNYFFDLYFNDRSDEIKNTYWFLISLDNYIPSKQIKNVFILYNKNNNFNIFYLIKYFLRIIKLKKFFYYFNNTSNTSEIYSKFFYKVFKNKIFNLYLPFENRPHQNSVINYVKKISKKNNVYGYYHRMPEPLQTEMFFKNKNLDYLFVNSKIQKKIFVNFFSWPEKKLKVIKTLRHNNIKLRKSIIYLPYQIKDSNFYLRKLERLNNKLAIFEQSFQISIHPLMKESKKHKNLEKTIIGKFNKKEKNSFNNISIILGEPGSVAAECLETYGKVIHITSSKYDIFSSKIWDNVKVKMITDDVYLYEKKSKQNFLNKGKNNNKLRYLI